MIEVRIPGFGEVSIKYLVCDYNGTLACEGVLLTGVADYFRELSKRLSIHVVTADTFGVAARELEGLPCTLVILPKEDQDVAKLEYVKQLGSECTISVGNGRNDRLMLMEAVIGIALIQEEGTSVEALQAAEVVCSCIRDALMLLMRPDRLVATLRS